MSAKIKRSQVATFINTSSTTGAAYQLLGVGVTTATIEYNPKTTEETYISDDTASISVDSYAPKMPVEMTAEEGDPVFDYVENLRNTRAVLSAAETDIVQVRYYDTSSGGSYPAEKQKVAVQVDSFGGDGGTPAKIKFTFNYVGTPTAGSFNPATKTFS